MEKLRFGKYNALDVVTHQECQWVKLWKNKRNICFIGIQGSTLVRAVVVSLRFLLRRSEFESCRLIKLSPQKRRKKQKRGRGWPNLKKISSGRFLFGVKAVPTSKNFCFPTGVSYTAGYRTQALDNQR